MRNIALAFLVLFFENFRVYAEEIAIPAVPNSKEILKLISPLAGDCNQSAKKSDENRKVNFLDSYQCKKDASDPDPFSTSLHKIKISTQDIDTLTSDIKDIPKLTKEEIQEAVAMDSSDPIWVSCTNQELFKLFQSYLPKYKKCSCNSPQIKNKEVTYCMPNSAPHIFISIKEYLAFQVWISGAYSEINRTLWEKNAEKFCSILPFLKELISGLNKLPTYKGNVFRGTGFPKEIEDQHQIGKIVEYNSFVSTSTNIEVAKRFQNNNWLLKLKVSKNCRDFQISNKGEAEILCLPGTRFKVLERDDVKKEMRLEEVE